MAKIRNTFTGGMDQDSDERLIAPGDYTSAVNARVVSSTGAADLGAVENVKGNTAKTGASLSGSGTNTVIGACSVPEIGKVYYFVHNSAAAADNAIVEYDESDGNTELVIKDADLAFSTDYLITGVNYIDGMLYWTDNTNVPRKINITKAKNRTAGSGTPIYAAIDVQSISALPYPPINAPTLSYVTDTSIKGNSIILRAFQFKYRYVYDDGEVSAFSPISLVEQQTGIYSRSQVSVSQYSQDNNAIQVTNP